MSDDIEPSSDAEACLAELRATEPGRRYATALAMGAGGRYAPSVVVAALIAMPPDAAPLADAEAEARVAARTSGATPEPPPDLFGTSK